MEALLVQMVLSRHGSLDDSNKLINAIKVIHYAYPKTSYDLLLKTCIDCIKSYSSPSVAVTRMKMVVIKSYGDIF